VIATGCSLTSLDGFSEPAESVEAGDAADATQGDATRPPTKSCAALHAEDPAAPDGTYVIDPDGSEGPIAPFSAFCDMTNDDGGWMLVTESLIAAESPLGVTVVKTADARGGLVLQVYMNRNGCGDGPGSAHQVLFADSPEWSKVRYNAVFAGKVSCWTIFGDVSSPSGLSPGLVPFVRGTDVSRNEVRMGGANGDAYDGTNTRCDEQPSNFWSKRSGTNAQRSATVILRRAEWHGARAGLATTAECADDVQPGTATSTWWGYSDIYVK
jgi:hypothetical protein